MERIWITGSDDLMRIGRLPQYPPGGRYALARDITVGEGFSSLPLTCGIELDGDGHTIAALACPLFASIEDAVIRNLTLEMDIPLSGVSGADTSAGLARNASRSLIENCVVKGKISGGADTAGLVGSASECDIVECVNRAALHVSGARTGGIVALANNTNFLRCRNEGIIHCVCGDGARSEISEIGETGGIGGIAGSICTTWNQASAVYSLIDCVNEGDITGGRMVGGIAGFVRGTDKAQAEAVRCVNRGSIRPCGNITETNNGHLFGGIIGQGVSLLAIQDCLNYGEVKGFCAIGGIAGEVLNPEWGWAGKSEPKELTLFAPFTSDIADSSAEPAALMGNRIERSENMGRVSQESMSPGMVYGGGGADSPQPAQIGGIVGSILCVGSACHCVNRGDVYAPGDYCGGIAGMVLTGEIVDCVNYGKITCGCGRVGGIAGCVDRVLDNIIYPLPRERNKGAVNACSNKNEVRAGGDAAGGIVGAIRNGSAVTKCVNESPVMSKGSYVGGIAGYATCESISCSSISGNLTTGGKIVGERHVHRILGGWDCAASALLDTNWALPETLLTGDNTTDSGHIYVDESVSPTDPLLAADARHGENVSL